MSPTELILRDPLGERALSAADFPVSVGGPGHTIVLPGAGADTLAWLALHDGQLFLQPAAGCDPPLCNGAPVSRPTWLHEGDVIDVARGRLRVGARDGRRVLDVEDGSGGNLTVPPAAPLVDVVSGGGDDGDERIDAVAFRRPAAQAASARRIGPWLVGALLVAVLGLATWFFATGHAVKFDVDPADSAVRMRGGLVLPVGGNHFARPGEYAVEIQRKGYVSLRAPIKVTDAPNQSFRYRLTKLPGILQVQTPVAARISVAGKDAGAAPGEIRLPAGRHELLVTAPRYLPFKATVDIDGMEQRQLLTAKLVAAWAPVTVLTEPAGATVLVDGAAQGATPAKLELDAGTHRIELRQAGFKNWVTDLQVVANQPQTLGPVRLGLPDGTLVVRTDPVGASVSVGGAFRGRSPVTLDVRPDVALALVASREGYEPGTTQLTVGPGERREVQLSLQPIFGEVTVMAEPASAEVFANGRSVGKSGQPIRLPAARTDIEVRLAGFRPYRTTVTPRPGLPQVLNVRLEAGQVATAASPAAIAAAAGGATAAGTASGDGATAAASQALTPTIRTKSGADLRLLGPASFTMGSPRRESGRRANESQRAVELRRRFYLATREATNGEFKQFRTQHRSGFVGQNTLELERQPVVNVTWQDAAEYCNWLSLQDGLPPAYQSQGGKLVPVQPATTGYRLPTESEWEWAARANRDGSLRKYPWGDALPVPAGAGNFGDRRAQPLLQTFLADLDDGYPATAPTGSFAPNPLGFHDLGGNVAEWTTDLYAVQPASSTVVVDPLSAAPGNMHVIRGSSWRHATVTELRAAFRDSGNGRRDDVGFRIARYAE
ncbi:MAG: SUMF1/EgtB/PvdO family nonheme iron enzyme [Proteobacteria bacterium]|nr:SUMF1/EgtB/PvdO family nonheme iron enzyme [Pseudomonadota bacterium]